MTWAAPGGRTKDNVGRSTDAPSQSLTSKIERQRIIYLTRRPLCGELQWPNARRLLNETVFTSIAQARAVISAWKTDYNTTRPHSALGYQTPAAHTATFKAMGSGSPSVPSFDPGPIAHSTIKGLTSAKALLSIG